MQESIRENNATEEELRQKARRMPAQAAGLAPSIADSLHVFVGEEQVHVDRIQVPLC